MPLLPREYYLHHDVLELARDLLGKYIFTSVGGKLTGGMIIETEAYRGPDDRASHSYQNRRTRRNEVMYWSGGVCYVYQCYGIHALLNVVTNQMNIPHAILIRAILPTVGIEHMLERRKKLKVDKTLAGGPGTVSQALGITLKDNGTDLTGKKIWIEDQGVIIPDEDILVGPRVGIAYAGEHALLPWRFRLKPEANKRIIDSKKLEPNT